MLKRSQANCRLVTSWGLCLQERALSGLSGQGGFHEEVHGATCVKELRDEFSFSKHGSTGNINESKKACRDLHVLDHEQDRTQQRADMFEFGLSCARIPFLWFGVHGVNRAAQVF